jgi:diacylglycerol kinase (ATP)
MFAAARVRSFGHAFRGCWYVLRTQRNAWLHVGIAATVFALGFWVRLDGIQWAIVVLAATLVFAAEFFNTAVEVVVDLASPKPHPLAKIAKDVAAAAVLGSAAGAVIVGMLLLGPPLLQRLEAALSR